MCKQNCFKVQPSNHVQARAVWRHRRRLARRRVSSISGINVVYTSPLTRLPYIHIWTVDQNIIYSRRPCYIYTHQHHKKYTLNRSLNLLWSFLTTQICVAQSIANTYSHLYTWDVVHLDQWVFFLISTHTNTQSHNSIHRVGCALPTRTESD